MKLLIQKIICAVSIILLVGILLFAGCLLGMQNERARLRQFEQAEIVTEIAVVNLDEGIYENGEKIYYSTELMDLEADYLVSENLETARQGILNGSYAAYILIPAEFSKNATSINTVPQKAVLEFAMNPYLREDVSRLTMANVKNFEISLNTNMSYMYVQALLSEFHTAQDMSGTILANDNTETERLQAIDAEGLLIEPEYEEIEDVDTEIEEVDFSGTFNQNQTIVESLYTTYESFVLEGEEAFALIKEKELVIEEGMGAFSESIAKVDIQKDEEGNIVYEEGLTALDEYLQEYNTNFDTQVELVKDIVDAISGEETEDSDTSTEGSEGSDTDNEDGTGSETEPEEGEDIDIPDIEDILGVDIKPVTEIIKDNIILTFETANTKITACNTTNAQKIENAKTYIIELKEILVAQGANEEVMNKINTLEAELQGFQEVEELTIENTFDEAVALEPFRILKQEVEKIGKVETEEYQTIFTEQVLQPLEDEVSAENETIKTAGESVMTPLGEYMTELGELDLYEYYDQEAIDGLLEAFGENIFTMEEDMLETHGQYEELVSNTIDHANETMETHQKNLEDAYESTTQNVNSEVNLAIQNRVSMNEVNSEILESFRQKLPYTRIGQLEYVQAYDFMVKPLKMSDSSISENKAIVWHEYDFWRNALIGMIILWCISIMALFYLKMKGYTETQSHIE